MLDVVFGVDAFTDQGIPAIDRRSHYFQTTLDRVDSACRYCVTTR
jgi:hypothetical protein